MTAILRSVGLSILGQTSVSRDYLVARKEKTFWVGNSATTLARSGETSKLADMPLPSDKKSLKVKKRRIKSDRYIEQVKSNIPFPEPLPSVENVKTLSIAVPGSIIDNAQSVELRAFLAGQIARALVLFKVDEVIIYNDTNVPLSKNVEEYKFGRKHCHCVVALGTFLQFLESPPFIRKFTLPSDSDLYLAERMNYVPLEHKKEVEEDTIFCEAIISKRPGPPGRSYAKVGEGTFCVMLDRQVEAGTRVTVKLQPQLPGGKHRRGQVVSPLLPKAAGKYWGYQVRLARDLTSVFSECPYSGGYDLTVGTSERGESIDTTSLPVHKRALIVFGGLRGLEEAVANDEYIEATDPRKLFKYYLNTCPDQGSRTIRTEEAILVTLATLQSKLGT